MDIYDPKVQRRLFGSFILAFIVLLTALIIVLKTGRGVQASQENCEQYYQEAARLATRNSGNMYYASDAQASLALSAVYSNCLARNKR